jgi:hypothetical protein
MFHLTALIHLHRPKLGLCGVKWSYKSVIGKEMEVGTGCSSIYLEGFEKTMNRSQNSQSSV